MNHEHKDNICIQRLKKNVSKRLKVTAALPFGVGQYDNLKARLFEHNSDIILSEDCTLRDSVLVLLIGKIIKNIKWTVMRLGALYF